MTRTMTQAAQVAIRRTSLAALIASALAAPAGAADIAFGGRVVAGNVYRVQARDPGLLSAINAPAIGLVGYGNGPNADDANTNYGKGEAASRVVKAVFDASLVDGDWSALVRVKAWHDEGLAHDPRPWGNVPNNFTAGAPLSDSGAPRLTRFGGAALLEAWVQRNVTLAGTALMLRVGQQSVAWGEGSMTPGGLESLNPRDMPGLHRAGAVPAETVVPRPMLFARIHPFANLGVEAYYQASFRSNALDACGSLWSMSDYLVDGCDKVMSGNPVASDRMRIPLGSFKKRLPTPKPDASEFGMALTWQSSIPATELGLYHARYTSRKLLPGVRRSTRLTGSPLIAGDPDGRNMAYFTEYPEGLRISAATFSHTWGGQRGAALAGRPGSSTVYGELSYRSAVPFMMAAPDVMPAFLSATAPSLLRARANAILPGADFRAYDMYAMWQAQFGVRRAWTLAGMQMAASAEAVGKHARGLPPPTVLRYGRPDIFGSGPVFGNCPVHTGDAARQCSLRGYATPNSWGYRVRLDARLPALAPQLATRATALFVHDVKGWSGDMLLSQGRKALELALRFEYRQRYLVELGYQPTWGGDYHAAADRDTASIALGLKF